MFGKHLGKFSRLFLKPKFAGMLFNWGFPDPLIHHGLGVFKPAGWSAKSVKKLIVNEDFEKEPSSQMDYEN